MGMIVAAIAGAAAGGAAMTFVGGGILGAIAYAGASMVVSSAVSGLLGANRNQPNPSSAMSQMSRGTLVNTASTIDPIPVIYGFRRIGGTHVFMETSGPNNQNLLIVTVHCEGEIEAIDTVYLDNVATTDPKYAGLVTLETHTGTDGQAASSLAMANGNGKWTSAHTLSGVAYSVVLLKYDSNVFSALPTVTADIRGRKVYDPRTGLTAYSTNPALCIRDYLTNARYGRGIATSQIDDAAITDAANYSDVTVTTPTGTQPRYTCNGVVNVDQPSTQNIQDLMTCCRGILVETGGLYKLLLDRDGVPVFTFNEDNIIGAWSFQMADKRTMFNRVSSTWYDPSNSWQPNITTSDSSTFRTADNGLMLEEKISLPYTTNSYEAQQLGDRHLRQSRFSMIVSFRAMIDANLREIFELVYLTHSTPSWTNKIFRLVRWAPLSSDEVDIVLQEYDSSVYADSALTAPRTSQTSSLPNLTAVGQPGAPEVSEATYVTRTGAGVKSKAVIGCVASADIFVTKYWLEYKLPASSAWTVLPPQDTNAWEVLDLAPGIYDWRIGAVNVLGIKSAYSPTTTKELLGLLAKPADVQNLTLQAVSSNAQLRFDLSVDDDVKIGGQVLVRHSPKLTGAVWEGSVSLGYEPGNATSISRPLLAGTYLLKFEDSSGQQSVNAASVVTDGSDPFTWISQGSVQEDPLFPGTFTNTYHDTAPTDAIELCGMGLFDSIPNFDALSDLDYYGGIQTSGSYKFNSGIDLGSVKKVRISTTLSATAENVLANMDDRTGLLDDWLDFDGTSGAPVDAWVEIRTTNDDPNIAPVWGPWQRVVVGDFNNRAFQLQAQLRSSDPAYNIRIDQLRAAAVSL